MRLTLPCYPVCQPAKILLSRVSRVRVRARVRVRVRVRVTVSASGHPRGRGAQRRRLDRRWANVGAGASLGRVQKN